MLRPKPNLTDLEKRLKKLEREYLWMPCPYCRLYHKPNENCLLALGRSIGRDKVKATVAKRRKYTCKRGHDLTDPNVYYTRKKKDGSIWLECKICKKLRDKGRGTRPKTKRR
jgi:hypothetical protein